MIRSLPTAGKIQETNLEKSLSITRETEFQNVTGRESHRQRGVYALVDNGEIVYIGQTNNLRRRVYQHRCAGKIFNAVWILKEREGQFRRLIEDMLIAKYRPKYNGDPDLPKKEIKIQSQRFIERFGRG